MIITQVLTALFLVGIVYVLCGAYYLLGLKRGYEEGVPDGMEIAQKMIVDGIKQNKVTVDGKKVTMQDTPEQKPDGVAGFRHVNPNCKDATKCCEHGESGPVEHSDDFIYGVDGDMVTCQRRDFVNLQESPCGFGISEYDAKQDLLEQEGKGK